MKKLVTPELVYCRYCAPFAKPKVGMYNSYARPGYLWRVYCPKCNRLGPYARTKRAAIRAWNDAQSYPIKTESVIYW